MDDALRHFLLESVASTDALVLLLHLVMAVGREVRLDELTQSTHLSLADVEPALAHLVRAGLVQEGPPSSTTPAFRFAPARPHLAAATAALEDSYLENPAAVLRVLSAGAMERALQSARRAFSAWPFSRSSAGK